MLWSGERFKDRLHSSRRMERSLSHPGSSGHSDLGPGPEADIKLSGPVPCGPVLTERCQSCSNILSFPCPVGGTSAIKPATVAPCPDQQAAPARPSLPRESQMCPFPCPCRGLLDSACFLLWLGLAGSRVPDRILLCSRSQSHPLFFLLSLCLSEIPDVPHTHASMESDLDWWHQWQ